MYFIVYTVIVAGSKRRNVRSRRKLFHAPTVRPVTVHSRAVLQTNMSERSSQCNRAIMVVTDGSPETYEELFEKYNAPSYEVK